MPPRLKSAAVFLSNCDIGAQYSMCLQIHIPKVYENEFFLKMLT